MSELNTDVIHRGDCIEVLRALRNGDTLASPATIAVVYTATTSEAFLRKCQTLGADAVFTKPMSFDQLRTGLTKLITSRNNAAQCQADHNTQDKGAWSGTLVLENQPQWDGSNDATMVWNRSEALKALDSDQDLLKNLAEVLQAELKERQQVLDSAIAAGDSELLRRTAHACKNSAGVMHLYQLGETALATENAPDDRIAAEAQKLGCAMKEAVRLLAAENGRSDAQAHA